MTQEVLKLALEALKKCHYYMIDAGLPNQSLLNEVFTASTAIKEALREHAMREVQRLGQEIEQEPVAWMKPHEKCDRACMYLCTKGFTQFPECALLQRTWVGLTDEEMTHTNHHMVEGAYQYSFKQGAKWAEAKLKQKNMENT